MAYYVLGPGGSKHGPAELQTLNQWVSQGRISPETLLEDIGSGVKVPARAVAGLTFAVQPVAVKTHGAPTLQDPSIFSAPSSSVTPLGRAPDPGVSQLQNVQTSNYIRPGLGTGGSQRNLFLPSADAKWALHGFLAAGGGLLLGILIGAFKWHYYFPIGRLMFLSLGLCIYGVRCGSTGINRGESGRGTLVIAANVAALIAVIGLMVRGFMA